MYIHVHTYIKNIYIAPIVTNSCSACGRPHNAHSGEKIKKVKDLALIFWSVFYPIKIHLLSKTSWVSVFLRNCFHSHPFAEMFIDSGSLFHFDRHCGRGILGAILALLRQSPADFTIFGKMTDAEKIMKPQHFGRESRITFVWGKTPWRRFALC